MPGISRRRPTSNSTIHRVTLGPAARAAFRAMNPQRFAEIEHGQVINLGPAARAFLRRKGVAVDRWPERIMVVRSKKPL